MSSRNIFNEATRVQMPALVHLNRLGYNYFGKISEEQANIVYDPETNILIDVFTSIGTRKRTVPFSVPQIKRKDIRTLRFTTCKSKAWHRMLSKNFKL